MANKTIDDILETRDEVRKRLDEAMKATLKGKPSRPEEALADLERMVQQQRERIESTRLTMEVTVERFENDIRQREATIGELQKTIEDHRKAAKGKTEPGKPTKKPAGAVRLESITGIGSVTANKLRKGGFATVKKLGSASPAKVARALNIQESQAAEFISGAKKLLRG